MPAFPVHRRIGPRDGRHIADTMIVTGVRSAIDVPNDVVDLVVWLRETEQTRSASSIESGRERCSLANASR